MVEQRGAAGPVGDGARGRRLLVGRQAAEQRRPEQLALGRVVLQQDAGQQVGVPGELAGARGVVGRRPARQLGEQPELAAHRLVQHPLVGDGGRAAGDRFARQPRRRDAELGGSGEDGGHQAPRLDRLELILRVTVGRGASQPVGTRLPELGKFARCSPGGTGTTLKNQQQTDGKPLT